MCQMQRDADLFLFYLFISIKTVIEKKRESRIKIYFFKILLAYLPFFNNVFYTFIIKKSVSSSIRFFFYFRLYVIS